MSANSPLSKINTLDDLHAQVGDLRMLLEAVSDVASDLEYVRDGVRDVCLDRVMAMVRAAEQMAAMADEAISLNWRAMQGQARDASPHLLEDFDAPAAAFDDDEAFKRFKRLHGRMMNEALAAGQARMAAAESARNGVVSP